jgi:hypothetical protein
MQSHTSILSAFILGTAMLCGAGAIAAELAKERTHDVTLSGTGTFKATPVGKERILIAWEENDLSVGKRILDHMTWHCFGLQDISSGISQYSGYCVITDPVGDQIVVDITSDGKYAADAKSYNGRPRSRRALASMPALAVVIPSSFTGQNSGRRLKEPMSSMAPLRAVTNCRNVGIMESSKQPEQGRARVALILPTGNSVGYDRFELILWAFCAWVTGTTEITRYTGL